MEFGDPESLKRAWEKKRRLYESGIKPSADPVERLQRTKSRPESKKYMRLAIAANCYECVGRQRSYRRLIAECEGTNCHLHTLRPYKPSAEGKDR
ncbi:MAG: hypothetical protein ACNS63_09585 [Candidatus Nitrospinota bacterium M3_3B_026]